MLTTKKILTNTSKELNIPYEEVETYYYAWVKGLKDRLEKEDVITFKIKGIGYINFSVRSFFRQRRRKNRNPKRDKAFKARLERARETYVKSLEERPDMDKLEKRYNFYRNKHYTSCPIFFYGYDKGYDIFEIERLQREFYNQTNKNI